MGWTLPDLMDLPVPVYRELLKWADAQQSGEESIDMDEVIANRA